MRWLRYGIFDDSRFTDIWDSTILVQQSFYTALFSRLFVPSRGASRDTSHLAGLRDVTQLLSTSKEPLEKPQVTESYTRPHENRNETENPLLPAHQYLHVVFRANEPSTLTGIQLSPPALVAPSQARAAVRPSS